MFNLINKTIAIDLCNTIADVKAEIELRLGHNPNPTNYFHPALMDKPSFFKDNLDVFLNANPIGNSVQKLNEWAKFNTVVYITARPVEAKFVTKIWLKKNGYPEAPIYFTTNKAKVASMLGVNVAIEDSPYEIEGYMKAGFQVLVKAQEYNINFPNRFDWAEFKEVDKNVKCN